MPGKRTKLTLLLGLALLAVCSASWLLAHFAADQRPAYRHLRAMAQGKKQEGIVVVCQRRTDITKVFIAEGTDNRRRLKVHCDSAQLALRRESGHSEWIEEMENVQAQWQETCYATPPKWCYQLAEGQPCQLLRQFSAEKALYYPHRRTLLAVNVSWQHMLAAGHTLPGYASAILQRGRAAEMAVQPHKGGIPHWRARGLSLEESTWLP